LNRFERAVHDCMNPTAELPERTTGDRFWVLGAEA
jgi:hypothetical protein